MGWEARLYRYPADMARLELLRLRLAELSSLTAQSYDALGGRGGDPVGRRLDLALDIERRIAALEMQTRPTTALLAWLDGGGEELRQLGDILRRRWFKRESWWEIRHGMSLSERTLRRKKQELLRILEEWAW